MIDVLIIKKEERDNNRAPPANKSLVIEIATERKALLAMGVMTNKVRSVCLSVCLSVHAVCHYFNLFM